MINALATTELDELYVAGSFQWNRYGNDAGLNARNICRWDGTQWLRLGDDLITNGVTDRVNAVVAVGEEVYVGGEFFLVRDPIGGVQQVGAIARWDGSQWSRLGTNAPYGVGGGYVHALATDGTNVYVGGRFTTAGNIAATNVVLWDGQQWRSLGGGLGVEGNRVEALTIGPDGAVYAGGNFTTASGTSVNRVAKWDGTSWQPLGSGINAFVNDLAVVGSDLYAGGEFTAAGGLSAEKLAKWDGAEWSDVGGGVTGGNVSALLNLHGDLYVGGNFTAAGGLPLPGIGKWTGSTWASLPTNADGIGPRSVSALGTRRGILIAAGEFDVAVGLAAWDGVKWSALTKGLGGISTSPATPVLAITTHGTNVYVGGEFTVAGSVVANRFAVWNGMHWLAPGGGTDNGFNDEVRAIAVAPSGEVFAGGRFSQAGGSTIHKVAQWTGTDWTPLGTGLLGSGGDWINALAVGTDGSVFAAGTFDTIGGMSAAGVARWDGTRWWDVGGGLTFNGNPGEGRAILVSDDDVYVAGLFDAAGGVPAGCIARWDGTEWHAVGGRGVGSGDRQASVSALALSGTNLYVGGAFDLAGSVSATNIARWDGQTWHALGAGVNADVNAIALVGEEVYIGGAFTQADRKDIAYLARWVTGNWWPVGSGIKRYSPYVVTALGLHGDSLFVGGRFKLTGDKPANGFGRWWLTNTITPPTVQLTTPAPGATFIVGADIAMAADVSELNSVSKVDFYAGPTLLGTVTNPPFTLAWNNVFTGEYLLRVAATDAEGLVVNSLPVPVKVTPPPHNLPPLVSLSAPTNGAVYSTGEPIDLSAAVSDPEGDSLEVAFYESTHLLATLTNAPFELVWSNNVRANYTFVAVATDSVGNISTSAPVDIRIQSPPEVVLDGPANGDEFVGPLDVTLVVDARDADGAVTNVEFYINGSFLGTFTDFSSPDYSLVWSDVPAGTYAFSAKAYDDLGGVTSSGTNTFSVVTPNERPTVQLISPPEGSVVVAPTNLVLVAEAEDSDGQVVEVRFFGPAGYLGSATNAPFTFDWSQLAIGTMCLSAVAVDDRGEASPRSRVCISITNNPAVTPRYWLTDLGLLGGGRATGVNNAGHVTGVGVSPEDRSTAFVYADGIMLFLDSLSTPLFSGAGGDINNHDVIVGTGGQEAFLYETGQVTDLGSLGGPSGRSIGRAINDSGFAVGDTQLPDGSDHAFLYASQRMLDLGTLGGRDSRAYDINNAGVVVGWSATTNGFNAFRYDPTNGMQALVPTMEHNNQAYGINDNGSVVGAVFDDGPEAFLWDSGTLTRLGTLGGEDSRAYDINQESQIVGQTETPYSNKRAFLWQSNVMYDLTELVESNSDWVLLNASAINNSGRIVGYGRKGTTDAGNRAFLLTPIPPPGSTNEPPQVTLLSPTNGSVFFEHDNITIEAAAYDLDGDVTRAEFFESTNLLGALTNRPFTLVWSNVPPGSFALTVQATDNLGKRATSAPVNVSITETDPSAPKVAVIASTSPEYMADVKSKLQETLLFNRVDTFLVRRDDPHISLAQLSPYDAVLVFADDLFNTSVGLGDVIADYVDAGGGVAAATTGLEGRFRNEDYMPFTLESGHSDIRMTMEKILPHHQVFDGVEGFDGGPSSSHGTGISLSENTTLLAQWQDGDPLLVYKRKGSSRIMGLNFYPPSSDVNSSLWQATSDGGRLMANALIWAAQLPSPLSVEITSPVVGQSFYPGEPMAITASATNSEAVVTQLKFYAGADLIGTDTNPPYSAVWSNAPVGQHVLLAVATDTSGRRATSEVVDVTVASRMTVTLLSPTPGSTFSVPTNITFLAQVTNLDAQVTNVRFYVGRDKMGEATNTPFTAVWRNAGVGVFDVTARATDTLGVTRTSSPARITIVNPANPMDVTWVGTSGTWSSPDNWTPRVPLALDRAMIDNHGTAFIRSSAGTVDQLVLGSEGYGRVAHTGGSLTVSDGLILGLQPRSHGDYTLFGAGRLEAHTLGVGVAGRGIFTQLGGTNRTHNLNLSGDVGGNGTYMLMNGLLDCGFESISSRAGGLFRQAGGTNQVSVRLTVGKKSTPTVATYELEAGRLVAASETIGEDGTGVLRQTGGENHVSGDLEIGRFAEGTYDLSDGLLSVSNLVLKGGRLNISSSNARVTVSNRFDIDSVISAVPGSSIQLLGGELDIRSFRLASLSGLTNLNLIVAGGSNGPTEMEVYGDPQLGFDENIELKALTIGKALPGQVKLVDRRDNNQQGSFGDEAMFLRELYLAQGSRLDLNGLPLFLEEAAVLNGTLQMSSGSVVALNGLRLGETGVLRGAGSVIGSVTNSGRIHFEQTRGQLNIDGNLTQSPDAILDLVLGGTGAGTHQSQLAVSGRATLSGALAVRLAPDYSPQVGDVHGVLSYARREGNFDRVDLPFPTNGLSFQLLYANQEVIVEAIVQPDLTVLSPTQLNPQTGLYEALIQLSNTGSAIVYSSRVLIQDISEGTTVANATGVDDGLPYVRVDQPLAPGETVAFVVEFDVPDHEIVPDPTFIADAAYTSRSFDPEGSVLTIDHSEWLPDGRFLIEFNTVADRLYYVQYRGDSPRWMTALPIVKGNGRRAQWIDSGPPTTSSKPDAQISRFYRIILAR